MIVLGGREAVMEPDQVFFMDGLTITTIGLPVLAGLRASRIVRWVRIDELQC